MGFKPIEQMWERVNIAREDSDTSLFLNLMYLGEMIIKCTVAGFVAAINDDRNRQRYRQLYRLVRTEGLGDWSEVLNEILVGPASALLSTEAKIEQRELTQRWGKDQSSWQYEAVELLRKCTNMLESPFDDPSKVDGRKWVSLFVRLRNKTRGHGAVTGQFCSSVCTDLQESIRLVTENFSLFRRPWAYLHRNLSGKYRVTKLSDNTTQFNPLKTSTTTNLQDGVYIYFESPAKVELIASDVDASDFFFPNGGFNGKRFELLSYATNNKHEGDTSKYLTPATELPESETQGIGILDAQGQCFGNLPPVQPDYIHRQDLETELTNKLNNDRHPIITLVGRGGIGKTSLALSVLHNLANSKRFGAMLWFSARDIDLLPQGPKLVKPQVLTVRDVADEFARLMAPTESLEKTFNTISYLSNLMSTSPVGPLLFIFDNFETVHNPADLYSWIDTYIRTPNKVLITTRFREFKGDYPVEVSGMTEQEFEELVDSVSNHLGIHHLLSPSYRKELYDESEGHPYVVKVLLGEVANAGRLVKVERIVANREEILDALFERTFAMLSPVAKRVFLTLCNWKSTIPQLALEAVLLRPANEKMDVGKAIEELSRSSLVEITISEKDEGLFLSVPLIAAVFGKRKLSANAMKNAVEADATLLHTFGAAQKSDVRHGISPRIEKLFVHVARTIGQTEGALNEYIPMLEFVAKKHPPAWLLLASLYEEQVSANSQTLAIEALRRYIEGVPDDPKAWKRLASLCEKTNDLSGEVQALVEHSQLPGVPFSVPSDAANRLNKLLGFGRLHLDTDEKEILAQRLVTVMSDRIEEADATDCSRLAWLCMHLHDNDRAKKFTLKGLSIDPSNEYCLKLKNTLSIP